MRAFSSLARSFGQQTLIHYSYMASVGSEQQQQQQQQDAAKLQNFFSLPKLYLNDTIRLTNSRRRASAQNVESYCVV